MGQVWVLVSSLEKHSKNHKVIDNMKPFPPLLGKRVSCLLLLGFWVSQEESEFYRVLLLDGNKIRLKVRLLTIGKYCNPEVRARLLPDCFHLALLPAAQDSLLRGTEDALISRPLKALNSGVPEGSVIL